jgi:hypothetical protein
VENNNKQKRVGRRMSSQDLSGRIQQMLHWLNNHQVVIRRQDGAKILVIPTVLALAVTIIIPQLVALLVIAHVVDVLKLEIKRSL